MLKQVFAQVSTTVGNTSMTIGSLKELFAFVLNLVLGVGFSLVLIFLAMGFIQYVMSQGDKANIEKAQKWVTYAVIGGLGLFLVVALKGVISGVLGGNANVVGNNVTL